MASIDELIDPSSTCELRRVLHQRGETATISTSYSFRPQMTRTFHPGEHAIEPQINGRPYDRTTFLLTSLQESK